MIRQHELDLFFRHKHETKLGGWNSYLDFMLCTANWCSACGGNCALSNNRGSCETWSNMRCFCRGYNSLFVGQDCDLSNVICFASMPATWLLLALVSLVYLCCTLLTYLIKFTVQSTSLFQPSRLSVHIVDYLPQLTYLLTYLFQLSCLSKLLWSILKPYSDLCQICSVN